MRGRFAFPVGRGRLDGDEQRFHIAIAFAFAQRVIAVARRGHAAAMQGRVAAGVAIGAGDNGIAADLIVEKGSEAQIQGSGQFVQRADGRVDPIIFQADQELFRQAGGLREIRRRKTASRPKRADTAADGLI